jgi:hypothetical protein
VDREMEAKQKVETLVVQEKKKGELIFVEW